MELPGAFTDIGTMEVCEVQPKAETGQSRPELQDAERQLGLLTLGGCRGVVGPSGLTLWDVELRILSLLLEDPSLVAIVGSLISVFLPGDAFRRPL